MQKINLEKLNSLADLFYAVKAGLTKNPQLTMAKRAKTKKPKMSMVTHHKPARVLAINERIIALTAAAILSTTSITLRNFRLNCCVTTVLKLPLKSVMFLLSFVR